MLSYVIKRVLMAIVTIFAIMAITFFSMNAIPGGPFDAEKAPSPEVKAVLNERYNLDKPLIEQFGIYIKNVLHGDFGVSLKTGRSVSATIRESFGVSATLGIRAIIAALLFGILFGCLAAAFKDTFIDRGIMFLSTFFVSVPNFVIASVLILVFCLKLHWFPVWSATQTSYFLPVVSLMLYPMSCIIRYTRAGTLDALSQNYIRTAKAKGLSDFKIIFKHALRNAAIPVMTYIGPMTAYVLTGSVVVETVFTIGGLGSQFINGIVTRDYSLIMGTTIFMALIIVFITLLSDILYKVIDPRIKFE